MDQLDLIAAWTAVVGKREGEAKDEAKVREGRVLVKQRGLSLI